MIMIASPSLALALRGGTSYGPRGLLENTLACDSLVGKPTLAVSKQVVFSTLAGRLGQILNLLSIYSVSISRQQCNLNSLAPRPDALRNDIHITVWSVEYRF